MSVGSWLMTWDSVLCSPPADADSEGMQLGRAKTAHVHTHLPLCLSTLHWLGVCSPVTNGVERRPTDCWLLGCPLVRHPLIHAYFSTLATQDGYPTGVISHWCWAPGFH